MSLDARKYEISLSCSTSRILYSPPSLQILIRSSLQDRALIREGVAWAGTFSPPNPQPPPTHPETRNVLTLPMSHALQWNKQVHLTIATPPSPSLRTNGNIISPRNKKTNMSGWVDVTKGNHQWRHKKARCYDVEAGRLGWKLIFYSRCLKFHWRKRGKTQNSTASCGRKQIKTDQQKRFNKWLKLSINRS